jgi:hypothetical protein
MGIQITSEYTTSAGVCKTNCYLSFASETLYIGQMLSNASSDIPMYSVRANARVFWDKAARDANKSFIDLISVSTTISQADLANSPYEILYNVVKTQMFPDHVDEIRSAPSDPAPAEPTPSDPAPVADPTPSV